MQLAGTLLQVFLVFLISWWELRHSRASQGCQFVKWQMPLAGRPRNTGKYEINITFSGSIGKIFDDVFMLDLKYSKRRLWQRFVLGNDGCRKIFIMASRQSNPLLDEKCMFHFIFCKWTQYCRRANMTSFIGKPCKWNVFGKVVETKWKVYQRSKSVSDINY